MKRTHEILLNGMRFVLKTDSPGALEQAARLVEEKLDEVRRVAKTVETQRLALLAALGLADELLREKQARERLRRRLRERSDRLLAELDGAQRDVEAG